MTKAAKAFGKQLKKFWLPMETAEYIAALEDLMGRKEPLYYSIRGRNGGTWCHPKLAVFFARWLDVRFAVWCDLMIGCASSYCVATIS